MDKLPMVTHRLADDLGLLREGQSPESPLVYGASHQRIGPVVSAGL